MRARVLAAAAIAGAVLSGAGLVLARGPLIDQGVPPAAGGGGLAIGDAVNGGTAGRVLFEGAGPVLDDDPAFDTYLTANLVMLRANAPTSVSPAQAQMRVVNSNSTTGTATADFVAINYRSDYIAGRMYGQTSGNDELGLAQAHQGRWQCSTDSDCVVIAQGGSLQLAHGNRTGTSGTIGITIDGQGVKLPSQSIEQVGGVATHLNKGTCALNGANPSQCSVAVTGSTLGGTLACVCSIVGTTHKASCQVSVANGTLTLTSDNGLTDNVSYLCW